MDYPGRYSTPAGVIQDSKQNNSIRLINSYKEGKLDENSTLKDFLTVQKEGRK